jgi:hypothetical protein
MSYVLVQGRSAIHIDDPPNADEFSPFRRGDARTRGITADDVHTLAGDPQSLQVLVAVTIER